MQNKEAETIMLTTMQDIEQFFENRSLQLGMNFGLSRMEELLDKLGNPHKELKYIHLAGSNGKGSTLHYIKEMLITEGYTVASFTSPFLEQINEQLRINDENISNQDFIAIFQQLYPVIEGMDQAGNGPTQFEILTAMAFSYFNSCAVDLVLLEAGLGGRLDSTNVIQPLVSIITSISLEHTNILGNTLAEIASEKAGIIKAGAPIVSGVTSAEPVQVIENKARSLGIPYFQLTKDFVISHIIHTDSTQCFTFTMDDTIFEKLELQMFGQHQIDNAALAVAAVSLIKDIFPISETSIRKGLYNAKWKGRFEKLAEQPTIIIDGAHNEAGIRVLLETLHKQYPNRNYHFVFTALRDKNYAAMIRLLDEVATDIMITEFTHERVASAEVLFEESHHKKKRIEKDWKEAINVIVQNIDKEDVMIITGSLYFLTKAREYMIKKRL